MGGERGKTEGKGKEKKEEGEKTVDFL